MTDTPMTAESAWEDAWASWHDSGLLPGSGSKSATIIQQYGDQRATLGMTLCGAGMLL